MTDVDLSELKISLTQIKIAIDLNVSGWLFRNRHCDWSACPGVDQPPGILAGTTVTESIGNCIQGIHHQRTVQPGEFVTACFATSNPHPIIAGTEFLGTGRLSEHVARRSKP